MKNFCILFVDDSESDQQLVVQAFRQNGMNGAIQCVSCGDEAIEYLRGKGKYTDRREYPYPTFIITDLKMPNGDGFSVLEHLKQHPEWRVIPTIVLSASSDEDDIKKAFMLGAASYFVKPHSFDELRDLLRCWILYWDRCEAPVVDITGKRVKTESRGKLGERFSQDD